MNCKSGMSAPEWLKRRSMLRRLSLLVLGITCFSIFGTANAQGPFSLFLNLLNSARCGSGASANYQACNINQPIWAEVKPLAPAFLAGQVLKFDASNSGAKAGLVGYEWALTKPDGSFAGLSGSDSVLVSIEPDMRGLFTLTLTVRDINGASAEDTFRFTAELPKPAVLPVFTPTAAPAPLLNDHTDAIRFLYQATFGPRVGDVDDLMEIGAQAWFENQLAIEPSGYVEAWRSIADAFNDIDGVDGANGVELNHETFMANALYSPDQLRHRMTYALSQLFVISADFDFSHHDQLVLGYVDVLHENAFGNYRDLMERVTLHPAMGLFLAMLGNEKADPSKNIRPDENYAREIMQLFTIGLLELNQDGTPALDDRGNVVQTYWPVDIQNYAAALTGWYFADLEPYRFGSTFHSVEWSQRLAPMTSYDDHHQKTQKKLLRNYYVPAGASAEESLSAVLDSLFYHPNLAPFVSEHLIKSFVTSNPSPEYVGRVSAVFNSNETGERGNLGSVLQAILFDPEARLAAGEQPSTYGRAKDPLLRFVNFQRFFEVEGYDPDRREHLRRSPSQQFLKAPNVFNFFSPTHVPNADFAALDLVAPELQILTSDALVQDSSYYAYMSTKEELEADTGATDQQKQNWTYYKLGDLPQIAEQQGTFAVIEYLDTYLTQGRLSEASKQALFERYDYAIATSLQNGNRGWFLGIFRQMIYQVASSPEYYVQR